MKQFIAIMTTAFILCTFTACGVSQSDHKPTTSSSAPRPAATTTTESTVEEYKDGIHLSEVEDYVKKYIRKADNTSEYRREYSTAASALDDFFDDVENGSIGHDVSFVAEKLDVICDNGINYIKGQLGSSMEWEYSLYQSDNKLGDVEKSVLRTIIGMGEKAEEQINGWHSEISEIVSNAIEEERDFTDAEITSVLELYNDILDKIEAF